MATEPSPQKVLTTMNMTMTRNSQGIDPDSIEFTPGVLQHADHVGFTMEQMRNALADPRWVNPVLRQPDPVNQSEPRFRYCGHGVAVVVEGNHAIAVIADDPKKKPRQPRR